MKLPKYKIVALCGEAGSGKDFLLHKFIENNSSYHEIIRTTTRPKREKEVDGLNYYFIAPELFAEKLLMMNLLKQLSLIIGAMALVMITCA